MRGPILLLLLWSVSSLFLSANPTGGVVANGSASIAGQGSASVVITQGSDKAIINWGTFSIGSGELTKFIQPSSSSATLNRVLGGQMSIIDGTLTANGQVYLLNGNGILVGSGGVISTAGFTGSTRDIADSDFLSGNLHFVGNSEAGVKNFGTISALGGNVVLIGKTVDNEGLIQATGTAALAAGDDVLLAQKNADGSTVTVNPVSSPTPLTKKKVGVRNKGVIEASTAELKAANGNIYALAIQNEGLVQATTVTQQGGHIYLTADRGTIVNSGTLDASATAAAGNGGTILVKSTAGKVVHSGKIIARGGSGGAGGSAEVSGKQVVFTGTVDLRADGGKTGVLLLDPDNLIVNASGTGNAADTSYISNSSVDGSLNDASFELDASNNLAVNAEIDWTSGTTLTLNSGGAIQINAALNGTSDGTANGSPNGGLLVIAGASSIVSAPGSIAVENFELQSGNWEQLININGNGGNLPETYDVHGNITSILPTFNVTGNFTIDNGATFLRADSGNGTSGSAYGLQDIYGVQGITGFLNSYFTLNYRSIDASVTQNWNPIPDSEENAGFVPIGGEALQGIGIAGFSGSLTNGSINNLYINLSGQDNVGLFAALNSTGVINNIQLYSANITGGDNVGGFAGKNFGQIDYVSLYYSTVNGNNDVGGLVGYQDGGYYLDEDQDLVHTSNSQVGYSTVTGQLDVGGAVGENLSQVDNISVFTYDGDGISTVVTGNEFVGGVVGRNDNNGEQGNLAATVDDTSVLGGVMNDDTNGISSNIGGIVGENDGLVEYSNTFEDSTVQGDTAVGGVVGFNAGLVQDTFNLGSVNGVENDNVSGSNTFVGGVVGRNGGRSTVTNTNQPVFLYGTVQTSYNAGNVNGGMYVGGVSGSNDNLENTVTTAYNVGTVSGSSYTGGLVGDNFGTVTMTYNSGAVSGDDNTTSGAIVGMNEMGATTDLSYWDAIESITSDSGLGAEGSNSTGSGIVLGVSPTTGAGSAYSIDGNDNGTGMGDGYSFFGAASSAPIAGTDNVYTIGVSPDGNGNAAWYILPGETRPMLTMELNNNVSSGHNLQLISANLSGGYDVAQNIDLTTTDDLHDVWSSAGFVPIGDDTNSFTGSFYGNGYTIYSLYIDRPTTNDVGLFGVIGSGVTVQQFNMQTVTVTGAANTGGVAGINYGTISYVETQAEPTDDITGSSAVGGIAGYNTGTLTFDSNSVNINGSTAVGGIAGVNTTSNGTTAGLVGESYNTGTVGDMIGVDDEMGGVVGENDGRVTQSYNLGNVNGDDYVGGVVGANSDTGQIDNSYSGGPEEGTISGSNNIGGIAGVNNGLIETTYNTSTVVKDVQTPGGLGALVGSNTGMVEYSYWDTDVAGSTPGIGTEGNNEGSGEIDVMGYTTGQLIDASNYAQGSSQGLWNFNPQGTNAGVWGINVYQSTQVYNYQTNSYDYITSQLNDGLPVLQWQTPVNVDVAATNGTQSYGYTPGYTVTGSGASQLAANEPGGVGFTVTGGNQAGDTDTLTFAPTTINANNFNVEFLNGLVNIVPAPLYIVANSTSVPVGGMLPPLGSTGATYTGLQNGDLPSDLNGMLQYAYTTDNTSLAGLYSILISGQSSLNYAITFIPGTLDIFSKAAPGSQPLKTFQAEINTIQNFFANDPANGLDPLYFMIIPNEFGLGGQLLGAINNEPDATDYAYGSSTSNLPAAYRLVTPGTGVVEVINGVVVSGGQMPQQAVEELDGVLSPSTIQQLLPLTNGAY